MNNNQQPFMWNPNPNIGNPMYPWPNNQGNCNCHEDLKNLEGKVNRMERQVRRLEERVSRLEATYQNPVPYNNYDNNYSQGYNMM